jgi:hypothetical protein
MAFEPDGSLPTWDRTAAVAGARRELYTSPPPYSPKLRLYPGRDVKGTETSDRQCDQRVRRIGPPSQRRPVPYSSLSSTWVASSMSTNWSRDAESRGFVPSGLTMFTKQVSRSGGGLDPHRGRRGGAGRANSKKDLVMGPIEVFVPYRVGTVRAECLDWILVRGRRHLERVSREYVTHCNEHRTHQAMGLRPPSATSPTRRSRLTRYQYRAVAIAKTAIASSARLTMANTFSSCCRRASSAPCSGVGPPASATC